MDFYANINHVEVSHLKIFKIPDFFNEICMCQKEHMKKASICYLLNEK